MAFLFTIELRKRGIFWVVVLVLTCAAPAVADPQPLTKEEQAKIDQAIDRGIEFLKKTQTKEGDFGWKMRDDPRWHPVGQCALPAYALLESGVPADDPVIQKAAAFLRPRVPFTDATYELPLAILFFDRLGDPKDKNLIQGCALRLIAGQHRTGGWAYRCPILNDRDAQDLLTSLEKLNKRREDSTRARDQALQGMEVPPVLQALTVFQRADRLSWQEPGFTGEARADKEGRIVLDGRTDNSNTQFALLGLWAARRHGIAVDAVLEIAVERFERTHIYPFGFWMYEWDREEKGSSRKSMTCAGLMALALGRGLRLPTLGAPVGADKDIHVLRGLAALARQIGKPRGDMQKRVDMEDPYFLYALERVGMLYNLPDIAGKNWYRWGAEIFVVNQMKGGWWPDAPLEKRLPKITYRATLCTSFALLFLKRSHPMKDLTAKLPFTANELNRGIASLRLNDKYPVRPVSKSSSEASLGEQP